MRKGNGKRQRKEEEEEREDKTITSWKIPSGVVCPPYIYADDCESDPSLVPVCSDVVCDGI